MRKRIAFIVAATCVLLLTGCGDSNCAEDPAENIIDTEEEPSWAADTQMEGKLFQNLNLDGIGAADDEAYVSVYQFGDYEDKMTVISIHLGTGETIA